MLQRVRREPENRGKEEEEAQGADGLFSDEVRKYVHKFHVPPVHRVLERVHRVPRRDEASDHATKNLSWRKFHRY